MESKIDNRKVMKSNDPSEILRFIEAPLEVKTLKEFEDLVFEKTKLTFIEQMYFKEFDKIAKSISDENIKGDVVNIGIYRGGGSLYMKSVFEQLNLGEKKWWLFDSFNGFNKETITEKIEQESLIWFEQYLCKVKQPTAQDIRDLFTLCKLEKNTEIIEGYIEKTSTEFPNNQQICFLHIDVDFGNSTYFSLNNFYPMLTKGAWVVIDDYYLNSTLCKQMVDQFINDSGAKIEPIRLGKYQIGWRKN
jgi:O-methyltransferase